MTLLMLYVTPGFGFTQQLLARRYPALFVTTEIISFREP